MDGDRTKHPNVEEERTDAPFPTRFGRNKLRQPPRPRLFGRHSRDPAPAEQDTAPEDTESRPSE